MEQNRHGKSRLRKLRATYRKRIAFSIIISLLVGMIVGFAFGQRFPLGASNEVETEGVTALPATDAPSAQTAEIEPDEETSAAVPETPEPDGNGAQEAPEATEAATPVVTPEPTPESTPEPTQTPEPQVIMVPVGERRQITTEIYTEDATPRMVSDAESYETLRFDIHVLTYLTHDYYAQTYATSYNIKGTEAGIEFEIMLSDYRGETQVKPNAHNVPNLGVEMEDGTVDMGLKVYDAPIGGQSDFEIPTNVPMTLYKRFAYDASHGEARYLLVTGYENGVATIYKFDLGEPVRPTPAPTAFYDSLQRGSTGTAVTRLQQALIKKGYLADGPDAADGNFGPGTEEALKKAQEAFGLTPTGIADHAIQSLLYQDEN